MHDHDFRPTTDLLQTGDSGVIHRQGSICIAYITSLRTQVLVYIDIKSAHSVHFADVAIKYW
jgi:predicted TIM-barrel enzyme